MKRGMDERYLTLDAMRGLAAIGVAIMHLDFDLAPHAHLAVDFFFALSGFVLTRAYEDRVRGGGRIGWFMELRLVRLWPLFCAGILFGMVHAIQMTIRDQDLHLTYPHILGATVLNLLMLPDPFAIPLFPTNAVFWSIFTEILVNLLFVVALARLGRGGLAGLILLSGVTLALLIVPPDFANSGGEWHGLPLGLVRTLFSFAVGMAIARILAGGRRSVSVIAVLPISLLIGALAMPALPGFERPFAILTIGLLFPLLLAAGARFEPPAVLGRTAAFLGDISYALYVIHVPIAHGSIFIAKRLHTSTLAVMLPFLLVSIPLAALAVHFWDKPVRRWLSRRLALRRSAMPQTL